MKLRKEHIIFLLALVWVFPVFGQNANHYWNNVERNATGLEGKLTGVRYYITSIGNSNFFLQKDWTDGSILLEDNNRFEDLKMRYMAYGDELVVYNEKLRSLFIIDKETVKGFQFNSSLGEQNFVKLYFTGPSRGEKYFQLIYKGTHSLLVLHHIEEVKTSPYNDRQGILRDTEFSLDAKYYMYSEDVGFIRLQNKRRSFLRTFPENKKEIKKLFRSNGLNFFDENGMVQAFKLLDQAEILK